MNALSQQTTPSRQLSNHVRRCDLIRHIPKSRLQCTHAQQPNSSSIALPASASYAQPVSARVHKGLEMDRVCMRTDDTQPDETRLEDRFERWIGGWVPREQMPDMRGKVALVTGANSGVGFETTRQLASKGCKVYMVGRNLAKLAKAAGDIKMRHGNQVQLEIIKCDLINMSNVVQLIDQFKATGEPLHLLVNIAGVFYPGPYKKSEDGIEQTMAINFYSHALLTLGLLDIVRKTPGARVVNMASGFDIIGRLDWNNLKGEHYTGSHGVAYATSKIYKMMVTRELAVRVPEVDFFLVHPGVVASPLHEKSALWGYPANWIMKYGSMLIGHSPYRGSFSVLYACSEPSVAGKHFAYFCPNLINWNMTRERQPGNWAARDPATCQRLFDEVVGVLSSIVGPERMPPVPPHPDDAQGNPAAKAPSASERESAGVRAMSGVQRKGQ